jgi:hypothetical protein
MDTTPNGHRTMRREKNWMPQSGRSEFQMVGFQCSVEEFRQITEAAENDHCATSEWIRAMLREAVLNRAQPTACPGCGRAIPQSPRGSS